MIRHSNPRAANRAFAAGERGVGQGIWQYTGHRSYTAKSIALIHFDTTNPNAPPFKMDTQTVAQFIVFNGGPNERTSNATVEFADSKGAPYLPSPAPACITAVSQRYQLGERKRPAIGANTFGRFPRSRIWRNATTNRASRGRPRVPSALVCRIRCVPPGERRVRPRP